MSSVWRALLVATVAAVLAAQGWRRVSNRRRKVQLDSARASSNRGTATTREEEIDALNAEQRALMLRELSDQV
jgi:hypothetical protein